MPSQPRGAGPAAGLPARKAAKASKSATPRGSGSGGEGAGLDLCLRLTRAYATLTRRLDNVLSGLHGLSFADFMILYYLQRAPGARLRRVDLAERLGLTASGVTRSLIPLEKLGLVSRQADPGDARVGFATLTDAGAQLLGYASVAVHTVSQEATATVPAARIEELSTLLGQLAGMNSSNS